MSEKEKSAAKLLQEKLCMKKKNGLLTADENTVKETQSYCEEYKNFLNKAKTER